jgi:hypothetical protein
MHLLNEDIPRLADAFKEKYGRDLIGKDLCQFHGDFQPVNGMPALSVKFIGLGKKAYLDVLVNENGDEAYHIRLKGIPEPVIYFEAKRRGISVEELYMLMYNGQAIEFDLLEGKTCFRKTKTFEYFTPEEFKRKVQFN